MLEQKLTEYLTSNRPEPPEGFDGRSDYQLARLTQKEDVKVKKKLSVLALIIALVALLGIATAFAAGLGVWNRGLEDSLQVTDEIKTAYDGTGLFDAPNLSVADKGVTVTLEQCIVDVNAAHIAFRVSGYALEDGKEPGFSIVEYEIDGGEYLDSVGNSSFYDGLIVGPEGQAMYLDGTPLGENDSIPFASDNGDLVYIISIMRNGDTLVGRNIHVKLAGLGTYPGKAEDVIVDVDGVWEFAWTLKGTDNRLELNDLALPIGKTGQVLTSVAISPIHMKLTISAADGFTTVDDDIGPMVYGLKLKNGEIYHQITDMGFSGVSEDDPTLLRQFWNLSRVVEPSQVESLLFFTGVDGQFDEVKVQ